MSGVLVAALVIGIPAFVFTLWPLLSRQGRGRTMLALPVDRRQQLEEEKRAALAALRELQFEHESGHISDDDYAELRARYERETAAILTELDHLEAVPVTAPASPPDTSGVPSAWRHPAALATTAVVLVAFGVALGVGISRNTAPEPMAGTAGPRPGSVPTVPSAGGETPGDSASLTPEVVEAMLKAARASLQEGSYGQAISAYRAILKRDPSNVDAMTHLGLIVAIGGHADSALETFEKALAIDPNYPPALLYRGEVLYEVKKDPAGAIRSWEKFLAVTPAGPERARVEQLIAQARAGR